MPERGMKPSGQLPSSGPSVYSGSISGGGMAGAAAPPIAPGSGIATGVGWGWIGFAPIEPPAVAGSAGAPPVPGFTGAGMGAAGMGAIGTIEGPAVIPGGTTAGGKPEGVLDVLH